MKKCIVSFLVLCLCLMQNVSASVVSNILDGEYQEYINKTGFKILNENEIDTRIVFKYIPSDKIRSTVSSRDMSVQITKGSLINIETEDEMAAIIAVEIAKCLRFSEYKHSKMLNCFAPKKYEIYADKRAVDMLVKAGYSPLALIVIINKSYGQVKSDKFSSYSKASVRMANIYEYIVRKYPNKLDNNKFSTNVYYQNFLLTSRENRKLLQDKLLNEYNNGKKVEYR